MVNGKRVVEVENGNHEAEELAKCDDQSDGKRREFSGKDKHTPDANELRDTVSNHEEPHLRHVEAHTVKY